MYKRPYQTLGNANSKHSQKLGEFPDCNFVSVDYRFNSKCLIFCLIFSLFVSFSVIIFELIKNPRNLVPRFGIRQDFK